MLNPEWEKLAAKTKNVVKVAYWDTTSSGPTPRIVGQIQGTPTIKIFTPVMKKNKKIFCLFPGTKNIQECQYRSF